MMTMFRSTGSCHLSLCKLPILPHVVTMKVTLNVTLPLLENRPSGKFIIDSQKGYTLAGALSTVSAPCQCVLSVSGGWHMTGLCTTPHSSLHRPHSWSAQDTSGPGPSLHLTSRARAEITKAMLQFPQGWPACHCLQMLSSSSHLRRLITNEIHA